MKINAILLGSTGMVGEGVLHECLKHPAVESVVVVNRRPCGVRSDKLKEVIHENFNDFSAIRNQFSGYNAGFFCLGISSLGKSEDVYQRITYDLTLHVAKTLVELNPDMTFCYVSGAGTDSSETGRTMWARIKGKTENDLMKLAFKAAYMFRPGYIQPTKGLKNTYRIYKFAAPFYPLWKAMFPGHVCTLEEIGLSMVNAVLHGYRKKNHGM